MKICIFLLLYILSNISIVYSESFQTDEIKVVINNEVLLKSDIDKIIYFLEQENKNVIIPLQHNFLKSEVIKKLITDSLILQKANTMSIMATPDQINNIIQNIAFRKNISLNDLKNQITRNGRISYQDYLEEINKLLTIKLVKNFELSKRIHINEKEFNVLFEKIIQNNQNLKRINLSYIALPVLKQEDNSILKNKQILSENIVKKLNQGYDFDQLYKECKKDYKNFLVKQKFWMRLRNIKKTFPNNIVNIIKKHQILGPFLNKKGFYILKVNDISNNKEKILTEFYVQHCLIRPSVILNELEAKNNVFSIYNNIKNKIYTFDYAVENFSHDLYSSDKKGDIGWISDNVFNKKELIYLRQNKISRPIKSTSGWHIFKILKQRKIDAFYTLNKNYAYNLLLDKKMALEQYNWIQDLQHAAYIKIM